MELAVLLVLDLDSLSDSLLVDFGVVATAATTVATAASARKWMVAIRAGAMKAVVIAIAFINDTTTTTAAVAITVRIMDGIPKTRVAVTAIP